MTHTTASHRRLAYGGLVAAGLVVASPAAAQRTLQVGPDRTYEVPSEAAAVAEDGDVVEIDAGDYHGDVAFWRANDLTLRGVGGMAHLHADGNDAGGKGIWVIQGDHTIVEHIEFSGASVPDQNGAGIRQEGAGLTVRYCSFHDNENGILAGSVDGSDVLIEHSEFARNGHGDGLSHNLYINRVRSLTFRFNYSHHAHIGHQLKSRAHRNHILYNRLMDESDGDSSYLIDLSNGGESYVIGNVLHQSPSTDNSGMMCYACEGASNPTNVLYVVNNTLVNDRHAGRFLDNGADSVEAVVMNNLFVGAGSLDGPVAETTNLFLGSEDPGFVDRSRYDYRLLPGSPAVDQGTDPGMAGAMSLAPMFQYVHPTDREPRGPVGTVDVGAYEHGYVPTTEDAGAGGDAGVGGDAATPNPGGDDAGQATADAGGVDGGDPAIRGDAGAAARPDGGPSGAGGGSGCGVTRGARAPAAALILALLAVARLSRRRHRS